MFMPREQNAGQYQNIKESTKSFETLTKFKYLGTNLTNRISIQNELKSRFSSRNVF
jgi:hypothetical protein